MEERGMADVDVGEGRKMESGKVVENRATTGRMSPRIEGKREEMLRNGGQKQKQSGRREIIIGSVESQM